MRLGRDAVALVVRVEALQAGDVGGEAESDVAERERRPGIEGAEGGVVARDEDAAVDGGRRWSGRGGVGERDARGREHAEQRGAERTAAVAEDGKHGQKAGTADGLSQRGKSWKSAAAKMAAAVRTEAPPMRREGAHGREKGRTGQGKHGSAMLPVFPGGRVFDGVAGRQWSHGAAGGREVSQRRLAAR